MNTLLMFGLVMTIMFVVHSFRNKKDRTDISARVADQGGELLKLQRMRKGHPFADTGRGWWVWKVSWRNPQGERVSWVLTTRAGIKDWRD